METGAIFTKYWSRESCISLKPCFLKPVKGLAWSRVFAVGVWISQSLLEDLLHVFFEINTSEETKRLSWIKSSLPHRKDTPFPFNLLFTQHLQAVINTRMTPLVTLQSLLLSTTVAWVCFLIYPLFFSGVSQGLLLAAVSAICPLEASPHCA